MVQVSLTGLGILLILASWRFMVIVSMRDACKDELLLLRQKTVDFFESHGSAGAASPKRALLDLLDGEIHGLHKLSLLKVALYKHWADKNDEAARELQSQIMAKFATNDPEVRQFVDEIRRSSAKCIAWYLTRKHLTIWIVAFAAIPMIVAHQGWKRVSVLVNQSIREVMDRGARYFKTRDGIQQSIEESFLIG